MSEYLKCKYCEDTIHLSRCVKHLKDRHGLYSTSTFAHFEQIDNQRENNNILIKQNSFNANKKKKEKKKRGRKRCALCGIIIPNKEYLIYHRYRVHGLRTRKYLSQNTEIYKPPKQEDKPFKCGDFLGLTSNYVKIYYSGFETNRRKH